jgi:voltage-gated potassium channel Kch
MPSPGYIGVDPDTPLGLLVAEFNGFKALMTAHLSDAAAHPQLQFLTQIADLQSQITTLNGTLTSVQGTLTAHLSSADPHTQYLTVTRANALYSAVGHTHPDYASAVSFAAHVAQNGNPHPQYVTMEELQSFFYSSGVVIGGGGVQTIRSDAANPVLGLNPSLPAGTGMWWKNTTSGNTRFQYNDNGTILRTLPLITGDRVPYTQGADVASAATLVLGDDGNYFRITGTTQIDLLSNAGWRPGSLVILRFTGALTVTHNAAASGVNKPIFLKSGANLTTTVNTTLTLVYDSTDARWNEV